LWAKEKIREDWYTAGHVCISAVRAIKMKFFRPKSSGII